MAEEAGTERDVRRAARARTEPTISTWLEYTYVYLPSYLPACSLVAHLAVTLPLVGSVGGGWNDPLLTHDTLNIEQKVYSQFDWLT